jgi:hypothetical protein
MAQPLQKTVMEVTQNMKNKTVNPAISPLGIYPNKLKVKRLVMQPSDRMPVQQDKARGSILSTSHPKMLGRP